MHDLFSQKINLKKNSILSNIRELKKFWYNQMLHSHQIPYHKISVPKGKNVHDMLFGGVE